MPKHRRIDAVQERDLAIDCTNEVWTLLGRDDRSPEDDEAMVRLAYAAAHHWSRAAEATAASAQRGEWLISRVLATVGRPEGALHHARRCLALIEQATVGEDGFADFDVAYAHEAMARAHASAGDLAAARDHLARARAVPVADAEDAAILSGDLAAGPWYGLE